jgi:hypothetical protein
VKGTQMSRTENARSLTPKQPGLLSIAVVLIPLILMTACATGGDATATVAFDADTPDTTASTLTPTSAAAPTASATVEVTEALPTPTETVIQETPTLEIQRPDEGVVLDVSTPITISGTSSVQAGQTVIVRVLDNLGNLVVEVPAAVGDDATGTGQAEWSITLPISAQVGALGTVYAFLPAPDDGRTLAADAVNILFGTADIRPFVTISHPLPYAEVVNGGFTVSGRGGGLFEGALVVHARDDEGNVLAEAATILEGEDVGVGGTGSYTVELSVDVAPGTEGQLVAFATSPKDGSVATSFAIPVVFGE